jgi:hypothetical protein
MALGATAGQVEIDMAARFRSGISIIELLTEFLQSRSPYRPDARQSCCVDRAGVRLPSMNSSRLCFKIPHQAGLDEGAAIQQWANLTRERVQRRR